MAATGAVATAAHSRRSGSARPRSWAARTSRSTPSGRAATNRSYTSASRSPTLTNAVPGQAARAAATAPRLSSHVRLSFASMGRSRRAARPGAAGSRVQASWASSPSGTRSGVIASVLCTTSPPAPSSPGQSTTVVSCTASTRSTAAARPWVAATWLATIAAASTPALARKR